MDPLNPTGINGPWQTSPTTSPTSYHSKLYRNDQHSPTSPSTSTSYRQSGPSGSPSHTRSYLPTGSYSYSAGLNEPKVFGAPTPALLDPSLMSSAIEEEGENGSSGSAGAGAKRADRGFLRVRITGLERNRKDLLIRFDASTNLPNFRTTMYRNMQRSYAEFQRFAEQAQVTSPQTIISALPLPSSLATTDEEDDRLVRIALQRWFTRICEDPALLQDEELRSFVESDFGYSPVPPPTARRSASASAVPSVFSAALSKVVRRGPLDEDDELASAKGALERLETNWGAAATAVNNLGKARRAYAITNQDVGAKIISLSTVESDFFLAAAERKAGRAMEVLSGVAGAQAASENVVLSDSLGYQALNARAAKDALALRTQLLDDAQTATKTAINKRRNVERLKGSSNINPIKVDDAISDMDDANALEAQLNKQLSAISSNLHLSLRQHSRNTHEDVALALLENARLTVGFHKHVLRELEAVRPDLAKVGSEKGTDVMTAAANVGVAAATPARQAPPILPQNPIATSSSQPHMTGSRPYDSPPRRPAGPPPSTAAAGRQDGPSGSQSMFLPGPSAGSARPSSTGPDARHGQSSSSGAASSYGVASMADPLGGQMAQSMVLPQGSGGRPATTGRAQGRRLDERQAAKLLAGGF